MVKLFDYALAIVGMFFMSEGFAAILSSPGSIELTGEAGSPALRFMGLGLGALATLRLVTLGPKLKTVVEQSWPFVIPVTFALVSVLWSLDPELAMRRSSALVLSTIFALFIVCRFDKRQIIDCLLITMFVYCVASAFMIVFVPYIGIHNAGDTRFFEHVGAWRGLSPFKNDFGRIVALAAATFLVAAVTRPGHRMKFIALAAFATVLAVGSRSAQSIALLAICAFVVVYVAFLDRLSARSRSAVIVMTLPVIAFCYLIADVVVAMVLEALGKDATLTGRLNIWPLVLDALQNSILFGGGYGTGWETLIDIEVGESLGRQIGHAHNGYLNLMVDIGLVGLILSMCFIGLVAARVLRAFLMGDHSEFVIAGIMVLAFILVGNWVGSFLLKYNNIFWVLLLCFYCKLVTERVPHLTRVFGPVADKKKQAQTPRTRLGMGNGGVRGNARNI